MSLSIPYDANNVFAKILRGELPANMVFSDDVAIGIMDLYPQSPGHCLIIPRHPGATVLDIPAPLLGAVMQRVQAAAKAVVEAFSPDGIILTQFNGAPAGQTVFHLHFHLIPRYDSLAMGRHGQGQKADAETLRTQAAKLASLYRAP